MLDLGWSELLVVAIAALIVVGPKDLPRMLRTLGQYVAKARGVAREFHRAMDEAARQADIEELHEIKKSLDEVRDVQYEAQRELSQSFLDGPSKPPTKTAAEQAKDEAGVVAAPEKKAAPKKKPAAKKVPAEKKAPAAKKPAARRKPQAAKAAATVAPTEPVSPADAPVKAAAGGKASGA